MSPPEAGDSPHVLAANEALKQAQRDADQWPAAFAFHVAAIVEPLRAEIERLRGVETGWQDIASAPRSKSDPPLLLLLYADGTITTGYRSSSLMGQIATHWMPLPPAPSTRGPEGV